VSSSSVLPIMGTSGNRNSIDKANKCNTAGDLEARLLGRDWWEETMSF
jgi:hypothetical protein